MQTRRRASKRAFFCDGIQKLKSIYIDMARSFTNFVDFPGEITHPNRYAFPTLHTVSGGKQRTWNIYIRLVKAVATERKYGIDWDVNDDDEVPLKADYFEGPLPRGTKAQMWVESGVVGGKITRHAPSFPPKKNVGRANERHEFQQALCDARSKWTKKNEMGGQLTREGQAPQDIMRFPMLLRKYEDESKHINFPAYTQPKLDGHRFTAALDGKPAKKQTYKNVVLFSRTKKKHDGMNYIKKILLEPLQREYDTDVGESIYIDGELYKHGCNLQQVGHLIKKVENTYEATDDSAEFWVFDCYYPSRQTPYVERLRQLDAFFCTFLTPWVRGVPATEVANEEEVMRMYETYIGDGYEGAIVRDAQGLYLSDPLETSQRLRSRHVLKIKKKYDDEFPVVGYAQGTKGKDVGAILWIVEVAPGKTLTLQPRDMTYEERYQLFAEAEEDFDGRFAGRMMKVVYDDLSKDGVPLRAKAITFR
jgi:hypothetical protein